MGPPGGSDDQESVFNTGAWGSVPGSGRSPGERNGKPTLVFLPGECCDSVTHTHTHTHTQLLEVCGLCVC